jgi:hypothetical protein
MDGDYVSPLQDDKQTVPDDAVIFRRVGPDFWDWPDDRDEPVISKGAFQDYTAEAAADKGYPAPCMSVYLARVVEESGREPKDLLSDFGSEYGLVSLTAGQLREVGQGIQYSREEDEKAHAVVFCVAKAKRSKGERKRLADMARWVVKPSKP